MHGTISTDLELKHDVESRYSVFKETCSHSKAFVSSCHQYTCDKLEMRVTKRDGLGSFGSVITYAW